ncbi:Eco57I restriction-modification methylase domain-containing protein, partial [Tenacibaculum finnmarkense]|uniref:Eco57I restriction-modification methylase domain-containing protein n=1 Tax=Tenacibaculum finnmarkense TaxID=2781243 RepID=UPI001EFBA407
DINPNSVKICRLRLWIELLKNAYYTQEKTLQTLPNIDINIKCGNSLISRFNLEDDLKDAFNNKDVNYSFTDYKNAVAEYKETNSKARKREVLEIIDEVKNNFKSTLDDSFIAKISKARGVLLNMQSEINRKEQWQERITKKDKDALKKAKLNFENAEKEKEEIVNNAIYHNAFEWRFEFPEVLSEEGKYIGFDAVIGNPPYVDLKNIKLEEKKIYTLNYSQNKSFDLYSIFLEKSKLLINNFGTISMIIPKPILYNSSLSDIRKIIFKERVLEIVSFDFLIFDDASVETTIIFFSNEKRENNFKYNFNFDERTLIPHLDLYETGEPLILESENIINLVRKIENHISIENYIKITRGLELGKKTLNRKNYSFDNSIPLFSGEAITKYSFNKNSIYYVDKIELDKYIKNLDASFLEYPRLLMRRVDSKPICTLIESNTEIINNLNSIYNISVINKTLDKRFILSILNSKLTAFYIKTRFNSNEKIFPYIRIEQLKKFPLNINTAQTPFIEKVNKILSIKKENPESDTSVLEKQIDQMVYKLYDLTADEIAIVEGS